MFFMNFLSFRRGVRKFLVHAPATVTDVSWPSEALQNHVSPMRPMSVSMDENLHILGVMNIHYLFCIKLEQSNKWVYTHSITCGSLSAAKST